MAAYTKLTKQDTQQIADHYNLQITNIETISAGAENSNYLLNTRQGSYVLTLFDNKPYKKVAELGKLLLFLKKRGFPSSHPVTANDGNIIILHADKPVMLKKYLHGQNRQHPSHSMLHHVGTSLAKLHQLPLPSFLSKKKSYGLRCLSTVQAKCSDSAYKAWINKHHSHLERQQPQALRSGLIHGDLFYDNVLFEGQNLKAFIDFEEATHQVLCFDLGMAIVGLCCQESKVLLDRANALIKGYEQTRPLQRNEKTALQFYVEFAATLVSCWRYWKYHIDAPNGDKANKHWQMVDIAENVRHIHPKKFLEVVFSE